MLLLWLASALAADDPRALSAEAVAAHPAPAAAHQRARALADEASVARRWEDPVAQVGLVSVPLPDLSLDRDMMTGVMVGLSQTLPAPGLPTARADVAAARVRVAEARAGEATLALTVEVETAYWALAEVRQLRALLADQVARTEELLATVRVRYETGGAGQGDLVHLEVLRDRLSDEQGDLDRRERALLAGLAAAVGREGLTVETPATTEALPVAGDVARWLAAAEARPALVAAAAEGDEARAMARMATAEGRPMPMVSASLMVRPGYDEMIGLEVAAPLPIASAGRARGEADAARARADAAGSDALALRRELEAGLADAHAGWSRAHEKAARYRDGLLPAAARALQTVRNDYAVGRADFASLYQAELQLIDLERALVGARNETRAWPLTVLRLTGARPEETP